MQTHEELFSCLENEAVRRSRAEEQIDMSKVSRAWQASLKPHPNND